MLCSECGAPCWAESVHNGVCMLYDVFECTQCNWTEDNGYPMDNEDWDNFLTEESNNIAQKDVAISFK